MLAEEYVGGLHPGRSLDSGPVINSIFAVHALACVTTSNRKFWVFVSQAVKAANVAGRN